MSKENISLGIERILGDLKKESHIANLDIGLIEPDPHQPRKIFDQVALNELENSIRNYGILQPIIVQKVENKYIIIAGERRWRASKQAGLVTLPAKVIDVDLKSKTEISLIENIQRENLNPIDLANAVYLLIQEFQNTQEIVAQKLSKSRSYITNLLRILTLPTAVQEKIKTGRLSFGHAKILVGHDNAEDMLQTILEQNLTVRETEKMASLKKQPRTPQLMDPDVAYIQSTIEARLELKTVIELTPQGAGKIIITFQNYSELDKAVKVFQ